MEGAVPPAIPSAAARGPPSPQRMCSRASPPRPRRVHAPRLVHPSLRWARAPGSPETLSARARAGSPQTPRGPVSPPPPRWLTPGSTRAGSDLVGTAPPTQPGCVRTRTSASGLQTDPQTLAGPRSGLGSDPGPGHTKRALAGAGSGWGPLSSQGPLSSRTWGWGPKAGGPGFDLL